MRKIIILTALCALSLTSLNSCEDILEEEVYSELDPSIILSTSGGVDKVLNSAYANALSSRGNDAFESLTLSGFTTGECWGLGGSVNAWLAPLSNFTWDANNSALNSEWNRKYSAIRDANLVLDNIQNVTASAEFIKTRTAEAKFIRAFSYSRIYKLFGPGPLFASSTDPDIIKAKASEEEFQNFVETNLTEAANDLPLVQSEYGRATKGSALGTLVKWYLNQKEWTRAAETAKSVIDLNQYELFPDYKGLFQITNEGNKEMIMVHPSVVNVAGNQTTALTLPTDYPSLPGQTIYAANTYFYDAFIDSFEENDKRKELFITEYVNVSGQTIYGYGNNKSFPYKYELDPDQASAQNGIDIPELRYADILLARAEALNELNGINQESVDILNQVRNRSGIGSLEMASLDTESFRQALIKERAMEFFFEGKSREDQIRYGTFISSAVERGKPAKDHMQRFPIPQREIDSNEKMVQNDGY
ncbi:RagB/SusD family nutrient uptake outer membrane protein [uncultured Arcticibacterium sp.]|uniref:RagB/SusD family nutrient uptake outer membrane protein n=1 Tax=uncultured Arcticibacterium sp. TaxID=2173042 RepID=UPI0030F5BD33